MKNFKSWQDTGEIRLTPLTGFFGANSSGKSSILQMLLLLKQTAESNDRNLVLKTGSLQEGYVNLGTVQDITHRDSTSLYLSVAWALPDKPQIAVPLPDSQTKIPLSQLEFSTSIYAEGQRLHVTEVSYRQPDDFEVKMTRGGNNQYSIRVDVRGYEPMRPRARPRVYMTPEKCYGFSDEALRYYQDTGYLSDIVLAFEQQFRRVHYLGPLREYPQRVYTWAGERPASVGLKGELAISALLAAKKDRAYSGKGRHPWVEERVAQWLVEMGLAASFETRPLVEGGTQYEVRLCQTSDSQPILISDTGFGVSQVLPVLVLCYYAPEGSTLIFEQPELHLHPSVQSSLADVFIDVVQKRNLQLIVESHSEHLIRRLQRRIAEEKIAVNDTALYFCNTDDSGVSTLQPLAMDDFGNINNWPANFFGDLTGDLVAMLEASLTRKINANGQG